MARIMVYYPSKPLEIPGPTGLPYIGVGHRFLGHPLRYQEELVAKYGRVHKVKLGRQQLLFLHDAYAIDEVLRKQGKNFPKSPMGMEAVRPLLGDSLPSLVGMKRWRFAHNTLMPLFTPTALTNYWAAAATAVEAEVKRIGQFADSGEPFDLYAFLHEAVFRVLMKTIFTDDFGEDEVEEMVGLFDAQTVYISARYLTNCSPLIELIPSVRRGRKALQALDVRVRAMIRKRQARERPEEGGDMLDLLLAARKDDGSRLTDDELRDNCMAMLFGGHETTAGTLTWTFGLLSMNPDARQRMFEEVDAVLADGVKDYKQVRDFEYTSQVMDEAMRLYPMFPFLMRYALEDAQVLDFEIKAGESIAFSAWTTHRDPRFWPEPEQFDPDRHTPKQKKARLNAAFLAFSQGNRRCIGERVARMEAYLMLSMISRDYELNLVGNQLPDAKVRMSIKPDGGMPVVAVPRANPK